MMLTGKAKELFEAWLNNENESKWGGTFKGFYHSLTSSMQWGVYQDWADSMGYELNAFFDPTASPMMYAWEWIDKSNGNYDGVGGYDSRQQARTAALHKLNEMINKR